MNSLRRHPVAIMLSFITIIFSALPAYAEDEKDASAIVEKMNKAYSGLTAYQDTGTVEDVIDKGGQKTTLKKEFSIWFKKPSSLRVDWTSTTPSGKKKRVLWCNGKDTYTFWEQKNQYRKEKSLKRGIAAETGVSGGATNTVPTRLLGEHRTSEFSSCALLKEEDFEGTSCYVISAKHPAKLDCTLWIGKDDHLIRKYEYTIRSSKQLMRDVKEKMEQSKKTMSQAQKKGTTEKMERSLAPFNEMDDFSIVNTQIHREITINGKIADSIFNFTPPEGARLVESFRTGRKSPADEN